MSNPTTKPDLIQTANEQFEKMRTLIESMTDEEQNASFHFGESADRKDAHWARDHNLRDVLTHLYEWHQLLLSWVKANRSGEERPLLPAPYTWESYGDMNVEFWKKHQGTPYGQSKEMVNESHSNVMALIDTFSKDELFSPNSFSWTDGSALDSYCMANTTDHYAWAMEKIKLHIKTIRQT